MKDTMQKYITKAKYWLKRMKKKDIIFAGIAVVVILSLIIVPFAMESSANAAEEEKFTSCEAGTSTISTSLAGTGTLSNATAVEIKVPTGVLLEEYLVENGDTVEEGAELASVDKVSVMSTIATVQENLDYITEQMNDLDDDDSISASVDGEDVTVDDVSYNVLAAQHRAYEDVLADLFKLYQTGKIYATSEGIVSGIEEDSELLLAASNIDYDEMLLANAPNGDDSIAYINYVGKVTSVGYNKLSLKIMQEPSTVSDYLSLSSFDVSDSLLTKETSISPDVNTPIYSLSASTWSQKTLSDVKSGDTLLLAYDETGENIVWIVILKEASTDEGQEAGDEGTDKDSSKDASLNTEDNNVDSKQDTKDTTNIDSNKDSTVNQNTNAETKGTANENSSANTQSSEKESASNQTLPSGQSGNASANATGNAASASLPTTGTTGEVTAEEEFEMYDKELTTAVSVYPQEKMSLTITIDELDILSAEIGQKATVTIDALTGQSFDAEVTSIDKTSSNNGGNTKYTITLTLDRVENMLAGMNASAIITLVTNEDVISVPLSALYDIGDKTYVYTSYDEEDGLGDPVEVEVGVSDSQNAQIVSGLESGAEVWYQTYE